MVLLVMVIKLYRIVIIMRSEILKNDSVYNDQLVMHYESQKSIVKTCQIETILFLRMPENLLGITSVWVNW